LAEIQPGFPGRSTKQEAPQQQTPVDQPLNLKVAGSGQQIKLLVPAALQRPLPDGGLVEVDAPTSH
jgi:hypothetical protein